MGRLPIPDVGAESRLLIGESEAKDNGGGAGSRRAAEVLRVRSQAIEPSSPAVTTVESDYIRGIANLNGRFVILLDLDNLLSLKEKRRPADVA